MISERLKTTKFRDLLIASIFVLLLRGFTGACEPLFFCSGAMAAFIAARWAGFRRVTGVVMLLVSCAGLFHDVKERIEARQSIAIKSQRIMEMRWQNGN